MNNMIDQIHGKVIHRRSQRQNKHFSSGSWKSRYLVRKPSNYNFDIHISNESTIDQFINKISNNKQEILDLNEVYPTSGTIANLRNIWHYIPSGLHPNIQEDDIYLLENGTFSIDVNIDNKRLVINIGKTWFNFYIKVDDNIVDSQEQINYFEGIVILKASIERHIQENTIYKYFELISLNNANYCY